MLRKIVACTAFYLIMNFTLSAQIVTFPNYGLKSHETLTINRIVTDEQKTTFYMTIENRINGGNFCADRNIYVIYPDGKKSRLISSQGIPVCPDAYHFKTIGEKLDFKLEFTPIKTGTKWVDLIEDCNENCFSVCGITLDTTLNREIDEAYTRASGAKARDAVKYFKAVLDKTAAENLGSEGILYVNIISLSKEAGDEPAAREWYKKLQSSGCPRLSQYIKYLSDRGIKF